MTNPEQSSVDGSGSMVVVGSSAGGIEALSILVATLPKAFPAPILVAQHLDPRRESHLAEILSRRSALPVVTVTERTELEPGTVYVVPANKHVEVTDHEVTFASPRRGRGPVPSVDRVLSSAADVFGERTIAVILTGTGSDGASGARKVKAAGGTVVAQDPETARFPSMPAALAPAIVDVVATIDAIGPLLYDLLTGAYAPSRPDDERALTQLLDLLRQRSGIDFGQYKRATVLRRIQRRLAATGNRGLRDYLTYLRTDPDEYERLTSSLLIKVTEFLRDRELFDHLRDVTLPPLIEAARRRDRELRLWSAGCATGEEAYSLAMIVAELLGAELADWTVRVFATDVDGDAVSYARRGVYPDAVVSEVPTPLLEKYFVKVDGEYEVRKQLRQLVIFGQHDLAIRAPFPRIDVALCRNVLIYFTPELQRRALQLFAFALRDGGTLVLGKAESTTPLAEYFEVDDARLKIYRRRGERLVVAPVALSPSTAPAQRLLAPRSRTGAGTEPPDAGRVQHILERAETLLAELPVGVVIVDSDYDIRAINPRARRLLGIHGPAIGQDLLHLLRDAATGSLRDALDAAFAGRTARVLIERRGIPLDEAGLAVEIECVPLSGTGSDRSAGLVVRDVGEEHDRVARLEAELLDSRADVARLRAEIEQYAETNRRLLSDNEEFARVDADLRRSNEDLLVANEEVQAATEEVETLNEELQSTNEELETLNEELQSTVEELNTTNDDMQARTVELQALTGSLEVQQRQVELERSRLAVVLESQRDAIVLVDRAGRELVASSAYHEIVTGDWFEADDESGDPVTLESLRARVAAGEEFSLQLRSTGPDGRRRWYEAYGQPVRDSADSAAGVLVIHDTTDLSLRRLQEEFVAIVVHELRTPLTALRGYLQLVGEGREDGGVIALAIAEADRLGRLVDELFDVARAETGGLGIERAEVRLDELVPRTVQLATSLSTSQRIRYEGDDGPLVVEGDASRLQQVLFNLITNAVVHAPDSPEIVVRLRRHRRRAEIEVEDHGPGVTDDVRPRLFHRFQRQGPERRGLGLGLYISREIVLAHGGTIEVDSQAGEGATFTVRLPLVAKPGGSGAARTAG